LSRNSDEIARGRIRQFESDMPRHAVGLTGASQVAACTLAAGEARQAGLRVIGTADARDVEAVHGLGAQEVIDYRAVRFEDAVNRIDAVIDLVGGEVQARSFAVLRPGGNLG
jgi:NADPH:quinone reductase-like Zn-dependent oxidoreductase